jgi:hypothetical protein
VARHQEGEGSGWTVSGSVVQSPSAYYELQLPLRLDTGGTSITTILPISKTLTPFTFSTATEPKHLLLDPDAHVFRLLAPDEIPVTVNSIKASKQLLAVITGDCRSTEVTFRRLLESLGKGGTAVIRENELDEERIYSNDLIFCGIPKQRSLLPQLPSGINLLATGFAVREVAVQAPDGLLFLVLPFPAPSGRITALFRPLSEAAADKYASKVTHYGTFGSLVFTGGSNRHKGTILPSAGGTRVDF